MDGFGGTPIFGNLHPSSARILLEWSNAPEGRFGWRMLGCRGLLPRRISRMGWEWLRNLIQKYQTCPGSSGPSIFLEHIPILKFGDTWPSIPILSIVLLCHALSPPKSQRIVKDTRPLWWQWGRKKKNCLQQIQLVTRYDKWSGVEV